MFLIAAAVVVKLMSIQMVHGEKYKHLAEQRTERMFTIAPNRGNLYSDDGSLLATSVSRYTIRFDAMTVKDSDFEALVKPLSDALAGLLHNSSSHYEQILRKARTNKNRYALVARNIDYSSYMQLKQFPLFNLGPYKGGFIGEQKTVR
jgi:cell division protein FtsI (penicillin-binding protein 3)